MINFTPNAIAEVNRLHSSLDQPQDYFRIKVSNGGCAELVYSLSFDNQADTGDRQFVIPDSNIILIADNHSYRFLENMEIDFIEDLMGGAFQFRNPQAFSQCTCGLSFNIEQNNNPN